MSEQVFGCLGLFEECLRACFGKFGAIPDPFNIKKTTRINCPAHKGAQSYPPHLFKPSRTV